MRLVTGYYKCGETLNFKTTRCKHHKCIEIAPHPGVKHRCKCEVTWTTDKTLAGNNWTDELTLVKDGKRVDQSTRPPDQNESDKDKEPDNH
jgi:hypothetical protein